MTNYTPFSLTRDEVQAIEGMVELMRRFKILQQVWQEHNHNDDNFNRMIDFELECLSRDIKELKEKFLED